MRIWCHTIVIIVIPNCIAVSGEDSGWVAGTVTLHELVRSFNVQVTWVVGTQLKWLINIIVEITDEVSVSPEGAVSVDQ